jgi:predicted amidohydrolase YtcJ
VRSKPGQVRAMSDLMLLNGKIYTMNGQLPKAEAVAVKGSSIIAVGENSEVENLGRKNFKVINLEGKTVIPGLTDCHTHFLSFAYGLNRVNLAGISSFDGVLSAIKSFSRNLKPYEWVLGGGWDKNILGHESVFRKEVLDQIWPDGPVALQSKDHHVLWVNSKALEAVGIGQSTSDPRGGEIERHQRTGEPSGILKENACNLVWEKVPVPSVDDSRRLLKKATKIANSCGLTGIHNHDDPGAHELFERFQTEGELTLRACFWIPVQGLESAIRSGLTSGLGNEYVRFGGVKMYADGSLGSQTALMFEPFEGSDGALGVEATSQEELKENSIKASRAGMGVAIHAIGDRAVHQSLNAIEESMQRTDHKSRLRHRIEHVQLLHPQDVERFSKLGIIASVQPVHAPADIDIAERYWGKRSRLAYAFNTLLESRAKVVFGSDVPIETLDPWRGIHAAVTRRRIGEQESWYPEEKVSPSEAISAYTKWASYASYEENLKGSIEVGKLADIVILSQNVFEIEPDEIPDTKVQYTILGGEIIFEA